MLANKNIIYQIVCFGKTQQRLLLFIKSQCVFTQCVQIYLSWLTALYFSIISTKLFWSNLSALPDSLRGIKLKQGRMCHGIEKKMALQLMEVTRTKFKVNHVEVNKTFWNIFRVCCGVLFYPPPPPTYLFLAAGTEKTLANSWISLNASIDCASLWCRSDKSNWIFPLP